MLRGVYVSVTVGRGVFEELVQAHWHPLVVVHCVVELGVVELGGTNCNGHACSQPKRVRLHSMSRMSTAELTLSVNCRIPHKKNLERKPHAPEAHTISHPLASANGERGTPPPRGGPPAQGAGVPEGQRRTHGRPRQLRKERRGWLAGAGGEAVGGEEDGGGCEVGCWGGKGLGSVPILACNRAEDQASVGAEGGQGFRCRTVR